MASKRKILSVMSNSARIAVPYLLGILGGLALWQWVSLHYHVTTFPSPAETLKDAFNLLMSGEIVFQSAVSAVRIAAGFLVASAVAIPLGLLMGVSQLARRLLEPVTEFFRFIPAISMVVFALIWFGVGEMSKIFLVLFNTVFIVVISVEDGVKSVSANALRAAMMMGATPIQTLFYVTTPSAVPAMITGMRIAMGRSFSTIVAAEMLGASAGLGYMIFSAREFSRMDTVLVGVIVLGLLGLAADCCFRFSVKRFGGQYAGKAVC